jgi:3-(3-hydroxy-phenyl)propionate hydroxylase
MSGNDFDIAIVGLGPVGCTAAILFAHAGLTVLAVERDEEVYRLPRAVNLDGEMVRGFQRIGLGDEINALLQPVREDERVGFANSQREWLFGQAFIPFGSNGWQPMNFFDQPELDGYLRDMAVAHPNVTARIGYEATDLEDCGDHVRLSLASIDGAESESHRARYLVGCDGASSFVRKCLDVGWHDLGYDHDWLVVDVIVRPGHTLGTTTLQVCDPDRLTTYVCTKEPSRRWEFKLNDGETWEEMLRPEKIEELISAWTPAGTYEIRRAVVYQFHAATADRWRVGNVFIAGDAAHQTPPFLGQGMNAGMRDAINLAWKFPMVLSGSADERLLDSYQAEREAHAKDLVQWAVAIGQLMEHLAAVEAAQRRGDGPPDEALQQQSSGYGQGREAPPIRAGVFCLDQVSDTGSTGYLFSQPEVRGKDDAEGKLDDLLGPGFAVVARSDSELDMNDASRLLLDRIGARCVSLEGVTVLAGHFDRLFESNGAAVVRPDRYVFGHTTAELSLDELIADLAGKLNLTPSSE